MWENGSIIIDGKAVSYECKVYDEPSGFGVDGGRISKLHIHVMAKPSSTMIVDGGFPHRATSQEALWKRY